MNITISSAKYVAPLSVCLTFSDNTTKTIDVGAFIRKHPHPQYNSYLDEKKFKKFKKLDENKKIILSSYSFKLKKLNLDKWLKWINYSINDKIAIAKRGILI